MINSVTPFTDLVKSSQKILVAGHLTPDFDAYACMLFVGQTIKKNFPDKEVVMILDTTVPYENINYLVGFDEITYAPIYEKAVEFDPELVVFVDGNEVKRYTKKVEEMKELLKTKKTAMLDHHKVLDEDYDFFLNEERVSCVEVVYQQLIKREGLIPFEGWEMMYLTGLIGDSYRFYYESKVYRDTFETVSDILDKGFTIREVSDLLFGYTQTDLKIITKLMTHLTYEEKCVYTYLTMSEYSTEIKGHIDVHSYKKARRYFIDEILNKIYGVDLCFTLAPDETYDDGKTYAGSFRSKLNTIDTTVLAQYLCGGGHVTGSGFTVVAENIEAAVAQVKEVIVKYYDSARL
jgi:phosphoesterase RecJ-like protein